MTPASTAEHQTTRAEECFLSTSDEVATRVVAAEERKTARSASTPADQLRTPSPRHRGGPAQPNLSTTWHHLSALYRGHMRLRQNPVRQRPRNTRPLRTICGYPTRLTIRGLSSSDTQQLLRTARLHHFQPEGRWPQHPTTQPCSRSYTVRISEFNQVASKPITGLPSQFSRRTKASHLSHRDIRRKWTTTSKSKTRLCFHRSLSPRFPISSVRRFFFLNCPHHLPCIPSRGLNSAASNSGKWGSDIADRFEADLSLNSKLKHNSQNKLY